MNGFDFECIPRIVCGDGASARLGELAAGRGIHRPLIVTDRPLLESGVLGPALAAFSSMGVDPLVWADVLPDPPEGSVRAAVAAARDSGADGVIGFGGGSSMDTAKLTALLACTGQELDETYGVGLARGPRLPLIQVPTTAGTGSEVTPIAIVTTDAGEKKGVVSTHLYSDVALLDPTLTLGLPGRATAMTGIDAMVHAIEAYTSRHKKNMLSDTLAHRALSLLSGNLRRVLRDGTDLSARRAMLQGSMLAGMAFANAPVGAVHALAYPLGGLFHVPHGQSNALVLVPVLEFNAPMAGAMYGELARDLHDGDAPACGQPTAVEFIRAIAELVAGLPFERRLRDVGVRAKDLPILAAEAMKVQRLLTNNPREMTYDDALEIYRLVF
jgi:alcohol dehydrogenase class IV